MRSDVDGPDVMCDREDPRMTPWRSRFPEGNPQFQFRHFNLAIIHSSADVMQADNTNLELREE